MDAVSGPAAPSHPPAVATERITWHGRTVEARVDHWDGRLTGNTPLAAVRLPAVDWTATPLGNGFFSLSTPGASRQDVLSWAAGAPGIASLEPDIVMRASSLPNDPGLGSQWHLANTAAGGYGLVGADIDANRAWDVTTGSRSVVVAVVDSGIDLKHPDLAANIWTNPGEIPGNGLDDDRNGFVDDVHGWNFTTEDANVQDGYGHGTHVAGIIGAVGNNAFGVTGINWQVSIMPLRFQDSLGVGNTGGAIAAINYATMMRRDHGINVVVVNNSWGGGTGVSDLLRQAIQAQGEAGITFVAAAGNAGVDCDTSPRYPACYDLPNVISVAASDPFDDLAGFSNYGSSSVDLAAPGVGIYSTTVGGGCGFKSGSSQAAPQVSGVVALLAAAKPEATVAQVRAAILGSVDRVAGLAGRTVSGGRLNAAAALWALTGRTATVAPPQTTANSLPVGAVEKATPVAVSGWAFDANAGSGPITVRLWVDGRLTATVQAATPRNDLVAATGSPNHGYSFAMPPLAIGNHVVRVDAIDRETGGAVPLGQRIVAVQPPIGAVEIATPSRIAGWAFASRAGAAPIAVRVVINGRLYGTFSARVYRPALVQRVGSGYHGYDIPLQPTAFRRGWNLVRVWAIDPLTGQPTLLGTRNVWR